VDDLRGKGSDSGLGQDMPGDEVDKVLVVSLLEPDGWILGEAHRLLTK